VVVEFGGKAERPRQLGGGRVGEHLAVGERHRRSGVVVARQRAVRDAEPRQRRAQAVGFGRLLVRDDRGARRPLAPQPLRLLEQLADRAVEDLVAAARGLDHVEVDPAPGHAAQHQLADAAAAPAEPRDQQPSARRREAAPHAREQRSPVLPRRERDGDVVPARLCLVEYAGELGRRAEPDRVVVAVPPLQLCLDQGALGRVVVGDHEQRRSVGERHRRSPPILRPPS
jgi:hypothetical protein